MLLSDFIAKDSILFLLLFQSSFLSNNCV